MIAMEPHGRVEGGHLMATWESEKRMERRRTQRDWEQFNADPEIIALRRYIAVRQRYQARHPYSGLPSLVRMICMASGIREGGRPPKARRCTKRLRSRFCWNWRAPGRIAVTAMAGSKIASGRIRGAPHAPGKI